MSDDDRVVKFPAAGNVVVFNNNAGPVLIIQPDGKKLRGRDRKPIKELYSFELHEMIDELCQLIARR